MPLAVRIALLRRLARLDFWHFGPALAEALVTRSRQVSIRRRFVARRTAAGEEAIALYRRLDRERPDRYRIGLARALVARSWVPDDETAGSAIARGREAVAYLEDATDRDALSVLAEARLLVAAMLSDTGAAREALPLAVKARSTWLRCAPLRVREQVALGRTLALIGDCREALDRPAEALTARQEAVDLYQRLSLLHQARWTPARLHAAEGLARSLAAAERWTEALKIIDDARDELGFWVRWEPLRARPRLGGMLRVAAECREALGDPGAAREDAEEAARHFRWLLDARPGRYDDRLAFALHTLAVRLARAGRRDEAIERLREAVEVSRGASGDALVPALAWLSDLLHAGGDRNEADELLAEAVEWCRHLARKRPEAYRHRLAAVLAVRCRRLVDSGRPAAALAPGQEAVELAEAQAGADERYRRLLDDCRSCYDLAVAAVDRSRRTEP
ncbi:hypothetical protein ACVCAH_09765 [Micromonospora sp. LZ34]